MLRSTTLLLIAILLGVTGCKSGGDKIAQSTPASEPTKSEISVTKVSSEDASARKEVTPAVHRTSEDSGSATKFATAKLNQTSEKKPSEATLASAELPAQKPSTAGIITLKSGDSLKSQIIAARGNVLIDFYADWCGPCRTQGKILHELESVAAENQIQIIKVNIEQHPDVAKQLKISTLPTLVLLKGGQVKERNTGLMAKGEIAKWLQ